MARRSNGRSLHSHWRCNSNPALPLPPLFQSCTPTTSAIPILHSSYYDVSFLWTSSSSASLPGRCPSSLLRLQAARRVFTRLPSRAGAQLRAQHRAQLRRIIPRAACPDYSRKPLTTQSIHTQQHHTFHSNQSCTLHAQFTSTFLAGATCSSAERRGAFTQRSLLHSARGWTRSSTSRWGALLDP